MRGLLLSTVALVALAGSAFAADLPSRKEAPVYVAPAPAFTWTGFYVGADIGGAFGSTQLTNFGGYPWTSHSMDESGVMGGGFVGYNYQLNQNFVLGVEGDFQGTSASANFAWNNPAPPPTVVTTPGTVVTVPGTLAAATTVLSPPTTTVVTHPSTNFYAKTSIDWLAAINGRLGVSYDRALFYAIGGAAWAGTSSSLSATDSNGVFLGALSNNTTLSGYDVGGGVEYAFTPNWTGRIEYRYYDFGSTALNPTFGPSTIRERTNVNTVRVGLAYLFSAPAPVVAKY